MLRKHLIGAYLCVLLAACADAQLASLVDFPVGIAVNAGSESRSIFTLPESLVTIKQYFNQMTAGNIMKMSYLHPSESTYTFTQADAFVSWALSNNISIHGHVFIWHSSYQVPSFMQTYTGDFQTMLNAHVTTIATHFAGKLKSWDVVNEVLDTSTGTCYRNSLFYQKTGKAFIANAFIAARKADPTALLYYNDYDTDADTAKLACLTTMLDELLANKVPIDGVGFQMHVQIDYPSISTISNAFRAVVNRGLKVKITEIDVPLNNPYASTAFPQYTSYTTAAAALQTARYKAIAQAYIDVVPAALRGGFTVWGLWDGDSWLLSLSERAGASDWPLLFTGPQDGPYVAKGVVAALQTVFAAADKVPTTPSPKTPTPSTPAPTPVPTTKAPTPAPTPVPTTKAPTPAPTPVPTTKAPTPAPTPVPTTKALTVAPFTVAPGGKTPSPNSCKYGACTSSTTCACDSTTCYTLIAGLAYGMCLSSCSGWECRAL